MALRRSLQGKELVVEHAQEDKDVEEDEMAYLDILIVKDNYSYQHNSIRLFELRCRQIIRKISI